MELNRKLIARYMEEKGLTTEPDIQDYEFIRWLNRFNKYNILFAQIIKYRNLLVGDKIVEMCLDLEYNVLNKSTFYNAREYVLADYGTASLTQDIPEGYLIANGVYNGLGDYLLKNDNLNYVVGVCGDKKSKSTQMAIDYYKKLRESLEIFKSQEIDAIEDYNSELSLYLISHIDNSKRLVRPVEKPLFQKVSSK